jgi:hypothetical protein
MPTVALHDTFTFVLPGRHGLQRVTPQTGGHLSPLDQILDSWMSIVRNVAYGEYYSLCLLGSRPGTDIDDGLCSCAAVDFVDVR